MAARISATLLRTQSDQRLIALAGQGSETAFEALVERYRRPLQSYCRRMLLPKETAEDVVQQAFLSTWQALDGGTDVRDVRAWLYRVTHNAAINALKRSGYDHAQLDEALHGADAPEDDLERRIAVRRTLAGMAALPELQREALLRTAVEGQSHEDVARELGLTDGAVRGLVYRARSTLRTAATALTPGPLVQWAASVDGASAPLTERIGELVAGGTSVGASALLVKGGATVLTAGALVGGVAVVEERRDDRGGRAGSDAQADVRRERPRTIEASTPTAPSPAAVAPRVVRQAADRPARSGDRRRRRRGGSGDSGRSGSDDSVSSGSGSNESSGSGVSGSSGSGSSGSASSGSGSSGSGSSGSGSSGSGSSGSGSSGSGSSGSGSSGSGGGANNSGPGSGGADVPEPLEAPEPPDDSSGSGSSGSGSSGSGSGSSGSGSSGSSGSGSGSSGSGSGDDDDD